MQGRGGLAERGDHCGKNLLENEYPVTGIVFVLVVQSLLWERRGHGTWGKNDVLKRAV